MGNDNDNNNKEEEYKNGIKKYDISAASIWSTVKFCLFWKKTKQTNLIHIQTIL